MYTVTHSLLMTKSGENVEIAFSITDQSGVDVDVTGALATYKISRRASEGAVLALTEVSGIALTGNTAIVTFDTGDLINGQGAMLGDFFGQLTITKGGDSLVVSEGPVHVAPVII